MRTVIIRTSEVFYQRSLGLFLLRVTTGLLFLTHGWPKVTAIVHTVNMFAGMGFPAPVAYFVAYLEVIGGIGLILGVYTRVFGMLFGIEMLVAALLSGISLGFDLYLSLASFAIALAGAGSFALMRDPVLSLEEQRTESVSLAS